MNCVYEATIQALHAIGYTADDAVWDIYQRVRRINGDHGFSFTGGACVPYLARQVARRLDLWVYAQYRIWTPAHYAAMSDRTLVHVMIGRGAWGVKVSEITLPDAVYLSLAQNHAYYAAVPRDAWTTYAFKFDQEALP